MRILFLKIKKPHHIPLLCCSLSLIIKVSGRRMTKCRLPASFHSVIHFLWEIWLKRRRRGLQKKREQQHSWWCITIESCFSESVLFLFFSFLTTRRSPLSWPVSSIILASPCSTHPPHVTLFLSFYMCLPFFIHVLFCYVLFLYRRGVWVVTATAGARIRPVTKSAVSSVSRRLTAEVAR